MVFFVAENGLKNQPLFFWLKIAQVLAADVLIAPGTVLTSVKLSRIAFDCGLRLFAIFCVRLCLSGVVEGLLQLFQRKANALIRAVNYFSPRTV